MRSLILWAGVAGRQLEVLPSFSGRLWRHGRNADTAIDEKMHLILGNDEKYSNVSASTYKSGVRALVLGTVQG
jgi:hypothetical protein